MREGGTPADGAQNVENGTVVEGSEGKTPAVCSSGPLPVDSAPSAENARVTALPRWLLDVAIAEPPPKPSSSSGGERQPASQRPDDSDIPMSMPKRLALAAAYIAKMPAAVAHHGGHNATIAAAVAMIRGFSLDYEDRDVVATFERAFNARCQPPWSKKEIAHKLESATVHGYMDWGAKLPYPTYDALHERATQLANLLPIPDYTDHLHLLACLDSRARASAINGFDAVKLAFPEDLDARLAHAVVRQFGSVQLFIDLMLHVSAGVFARSQIDPTKYLRGKYAEGLLRFAHDMTALVRVRFFAADVSRTKLRRSDAAQVSATMYLVPSVGGARFEHRVAIRLGEPAAGELAGEWEETLAALPHERFLHRAEETLVECEAKVEAQGTPFGYARVRGLRTEALAVAKPSARTGKLAVRYLLPLSFASTAKAMAAVVAPVSAPSFRVPASTAASRPAAPTTASRPMAPKSPSLTAAILKGTQP